MNTMMLWSLVPLFSFLLLLVLEKKIPARKMERCFTKNDWLMNLSGFLMQGLVIPLLGYCLATYWLPGFIPEFRGILSLGFTGSFLLNFVGVDFLYYFQHRAFHQVPWLWKLHAPHHHSPIVNIWVTSRNALITHFLFVYLLVNPILGYLCDSSEGFFAGAMVTAALDLFRHANIHAKLPWLNSVLILPKDHHRHHDADRPFANYGANLTIWDYIFGTSASDCKYPEAYSTEKPPSLGTQLLYPWRA